MKYFFAIIAIIAQPNQNKAFRLSSPLWSEIWCNLVTQHNFLFRGHLCRLNNIWPWPICCSSFYCFHLPCLHWIASVPCTFKAQKLNKSNLNPCWNHFHEIFHRHPSMPHSSGQGPQGGDRRHLPQRRRDRDWHRSNVDKLPIHWRYCKQCL